MSRKKGWSAYDVPHLRNDLILSLDVARKNMATAHDALAAVGKLNEAQIVMQHYGSVVDQRSNLQPNELPMHFVSPSMCDLVIDMSTDVPEWTASRAMPGESGYLIFARPMIDMTYATDSYQTQTPVRGLFWYTDADGFVIVILLTDRSNEKVVRDADGDLIHKLGLIQFHRSATQGSDRKVTDVQRNDSIVDIGEFDQNAEFAKAIALIGATWLLMSQDRITEVTDTPVRTKARDGSGRKVVRDVVVRERSLVRRLSKHRESADRQQTDGESSRRFSKAWWSVRGHWRQQACGPQWSERRPVYIEPHIATPDSEVVDVEEGAKPEVTRWRR